MKSTKKCFVVQNAMSFRNRRRQMTTKPRSARRKIKDLRAVAVDMPPRIPRSYFATGGEVAAVQIARILPEASYFFLKIHPVRAAGDIFLPRWQRKRKVHGCNHFGG
ncbi:hypothetical protein JW933_02560, partial [candidate division FCPU426 bacterium]|nr:hypothetical protein [candidate division FCPU426 bacterium]